MTLHTESPNTHSKAYISCKIVTYLAPIPIDVNFATKIPGAAGASIAPTLIASRKVKSDPYVYLKQSPRIIILTNKHGNEIIKPFTISFFKI